MDISVPMELMPDGIYEAFNSGDATMMAIIFDETTSADGTMEAIENIRKVADKNCFLSGMSAVVTDTKNLSEREAPIYVCIAVLLSCLVLSLTMDSFLIPFLFLMSIGMAILYNLGEQCIHGRDFLYYQSAQRGPAAGSHHGLFHFPVAQLSGKNAQMPDKRRPWQAPLQIPSPRW